MPSAVSIRPVAVEPIDGGGFAPFGTVIRADTLDAPTFNRSPGNLGVLWVQHQVDFPTQPYLGTLRYYYRGARCEFMQRHPQSTVILIPMGGSSVVFAAADDDGRPALQDVHAFLLEGGRGAAFHRNTWLRYAYPLGAFADFAYITQRVDPETANTTDDTERCNLAGELGAVLEFAFMAPPGPGFDIDDAGVVRAGPERMPPWQ